MKNDLPAVTPPRAGVCRRFLPAAVLALACLAAFAPARLIAQGARGEAQVAIISILANPAPTDEISIRLMNRTDRETLERILQALAARFGAAPAGVKYTEKNVDNPDYAGIAVTCTLPIVPRGESYLPIAPFAQAFAPYVQRVRMVYDIKGDYAYRGYLQPYADRDLSFTVTPRINTANTTEAFYEMDINIKNSSLTSVAFLNYPEQGRRPHSSRYVRLVLAAGVAIIILALGLLLALLLPQRKKAKSAAPDDPTRDLSIGGGPC